MTKQKGNRDNHHDSYQKDQIETNGMETRPNVENLCMQQQMDHQVLNDQVIGVSP